MVGVAGLSIGGPLVGLLVLIAFVSGVGITLLGPGGIFLTVSLFLLTSLSSNTIAGTVQVAFVATGLLGSAVYVRSGELSRDSVAVVALLSGGSAGGALFGAWLNPFVSRASFGALLGLLSAVVGLFIVYRSRRSVDPVLAVDPDSAAGRAGYAGLGFALGALSGLLGVGGPVVAVPALVLVGVPILQAVAFAQVQSVFIATFAAAGYAAQGSIAPVVAVLVGLPLLAGVVAGWRTAHLVDPDRLEVGLGVVLVLLAPLLAL